MKSCPTCKDKSCSHVKAIVKKNKKDGKGGPGMPLPGLPPSPMGVNPATALPPGDPIAMMGVGAPPVMPPLGLPGALPGVKLPSMPMRISKTTSKPHRSTRGVKTIGRFKALRSPAKMGLLKSTLRGGGKKTTNAYRPRVLTRKPKF